MDTFRVTNSSNFNLILLFLMSLYSFQSSLAHQFPSVVTFNEDYIGKALRLTSGGGGGRGSGVISKSARSSSSLEESHADHIVPICCSMETDDVMFFECYNTLSTSSKETVFKQKTWIAPKILVSTKMSTKFRWVVIPLLLRFENSFLKCNPSGFTASLSLNSSSPRGSYFLPDGYLKHDNEYFRPDEYCISGLNKERVEVQVCKVNCNDPTTPCIQKCCGRDQIYSFGYGDHPRGCVDTERAKWFPTLYHDLETKLSSQELIQLNPHIIHKFPTSFKFNCRFNKTTVFPHGKEIAGFLSSFTHKPFRNLEFRLRKDGWLLYPKKDDNGLEAPVAKYIENYCIDGAQDYGESTEFTNTETKTVLFLCSGGVDEAFDTKKPQSISSVSKPVPATSKPLSTSSISSISSLSEEEETASSEISSSIISPDTGNILGQLDPIPNLLEPIPPLEVLAEVPVLKLPGQLHPIPQPVTIVAKPNLAQIRKKKPALSQTTFNHNNNHIHGSDQNLQGSDLLLGPRRGIPTCCGFSPDVNDGFTHHCRNRRMDLSNGAEPGITYTPTWNVPPHFMTKDKGDSFLLNSVPLSCGSGKFQFQGFIHNFEQERAKFPGEKKHGILADGFLKYENEFYAPTEYCINGLSPRIVEVLICKPDCSMWETPCLKKCCGLDEIYNLGLSSGNRGCQPLGLGEAKFSPTLYKDMATPISPVERNNVQPHFIQNYPPNFQNTCYNKITLAFPFSKEIAEKLTPADSTERGGVHFKHLNFRFRKDGKLIYNYPVSDVASFDSVYDRGEYCVDAVRDYGETDNGFSNRDNQTILFICASAPH